MAIKRIANKSDLARIWHYRWMCRTNLLWLCHNVLDFTDINEHVHGPMMRSLQQFKTFPIEVARERDKILDNGTFLYTPSDPYLELEGMRRRMLLFSRGFFKTTCNTIAHSIQWLLNYPQGALCLLFSTDGKSQTVLKNGILQHFKYNQKLRSLFPEYCPQTRIADFGSSESFILPNRESVLQRLKRPLRVEPSLMAQSLDKGQAGYHFDVIKCSDIVEEKNVQTVEQRQLVFTRFGLLSKLLVKRSDGQDGWIDLEGTFYNPDDLHCHMIKHWLDEEEKGLPHSMQVFVNGCFERDTGGAPRKYDPSELSLPFLLDANGKRVPTWPGSDSIAKLEMEEVHPTDGGAVFAYQRVLDIKADKSQERPFKRDPYFVAKADFASVPVAYRLASVDTADTTGPKSNNSVITVCAYDRMGRCYVEHIQRGKWTSDDLISRMFMVWKDYQGKGLKKIAIEETGYVKGFKSSLDRKSNLEKVWPIWHLFKTDNSPNSKVRNIISALQPPYNSGHGGAPDLRFVAGLGYPEGSSQAKEVEKALRVELQGCTVFSTGDSDDILDTLVAQYKTREYFGEEFAMNVQEKEAQDRMLNEVFKPLTKEQHETALQKLIFPDERVGVSADDFFRASGW